MNRLDALLLLALLLPTAIVTILHPLLCPGMRLLICDACQFVILNLFQLVPEDAVHLLPKLTIGFRPFARSRSTSRSNSWIFPRAIVVTS